MGSVNDFPGSSQVGVNDFLSFNCWMAYFNIGRVARLGNSTQINVSLQSQPEA